MTNIDITHTLSSYNYNAIINRPSGVWLKADQTGKLERVSGIGKLFFIIKNILTCNQTVKRTASVINQTCLQLVNSVQNASNEPLSKDNSFIQEYASDIQKLIQSVKKISPRLYDPSTLNDLKDLVKRPEVAEAKLALKKGQTPELLSDGVNGSYILKDRNGSPLGIFKPREQEVGCSQNPKHFALMGDLVQKQFGIKPGTSYQRERVAYLLDQEGFANVPKTDIARIAKRHFRYYEEGHYTGSFQRFIPGCKHAWDHYQILPSFLSSARGHLIPEHEIHKIAILDIRLLNCDRHLQNFLVDDKWNTHPIDHGYTLPSNASSLRFNWMNFSQSKTAFTDEECEYIQSLDVNRDLALIKKKIPSISAEALFRFKIASLLLKKAAERGLTPYQIGELMIGKSPDNMSAWINYFLPVAATNKPSYFETRICKPLIGKDDDEINNFLDRKISSYLNQ